MRGLRRIAACGLVCGGITTGALQVSTPRPPARAVQYRVVDIGTLPGCDVTYAESVNDTGWVVGYAYTFVPPGHGNSMLAHPFLWRNGTITKLATLGGDHGQALTINSRGDVGGYAEKPGYEDLPVVWRRSAGYEPTPLSSMRGRVICLRDDGVACGNVQTGGHGRAALWVGGDLRILGNTQDEEDNGYSVNRTGTVVGMFVPPGGSAQSFMSPGDRHAVTWEGAREHALPEFREANDAEPGRYRPSHLSECLGVADDGTVVGWSDSATGRIGCTWRNGKIAALPRPEGYNTEAHAIARDGTIVGDEMERASKTGWKSNACIWRGGKIEDLNDLIPSDTGWHLNVASHVSNAGYISGYGSCDKFPNDRWRAFVLVPVSTRPPGRSVIRR